MDDFIVFVREVQCFKTKTDPILMKSAEDEFSIQRYVMVSISRDFISRDVLILVVSFVAGSNEI